MATAHIYEPPLPHIGTAATFGLKVAENTVGTLAPTTALFTLPFTAYFLCLSQRVIKIRKETGTHMGDLSTQHPGDTTPHHHHKARDPLFVAIRAHANYLETVPLGLILALVAEVNGANRRCLAWALGWLWALRLVHVEAGFRRKETLGVGRKIGYYGTQAWLVGMSAWCVHLSRKYWGF